MPAMPTNPPKPSLDYGSRKLPQIENCNLAMQVDGGRWEGKIEGLDFNSSTFDIIIIDGPRRAVN